MKKKYSYIGLSLVILIFGILVIPEIVKRLSDGTMVDSDNMTGRTSVETKSERDKDNQKLAYVVLNGEKQMAPPFKFVDQHGDTITNRDYAGKVYVVEFFFSTCPTICPIMNENLAEVEKEFKDDPYFGIASFTIDPKHDTPEVLNDYAKEHNITDPDWHLMTGDQETIYKLAQEGYMFNAAEAPNAEGGFLHSGMFALIDQNGYLRSRKDEFGNQILYYRGYLKKGSIVEQGDEEPQIDILIEDIKKLK